MVGGLACILINVSFSSHITNANPGILTNQRFNQHTIPKILLFCCTSSCLQQTIPLLRSAFMVHGFAETLPNVSPASHLRNPHINTLPYQSFDQHRTKISAILLHVVLFAASNLCLKKRTHTRSIWDRLHDPRISSQTTTRHPSTLTNENFNSIPYERCCYFVAYRRVCSKQSMSHKLCPL
jgi:hypothetical protein